MQMPLSAHVPHPELAPLDRVVAKYRRDVHRLAPPAAPEALTSLEGHLGHRLPAGLRRFLLEHNGGFLFRGALVLRSAAEMAIASEAAPQVVLFADGAGEERWAWSFDAVGPVIGRWDGQQLTPRYRSFAGWLASSLSVIETRLPQGPDRDALCFEASPDDPFQLIHAGARALAEGRPEEAEELLRRATTVDPSLVQGWQYLGDALAISDRPAARRAWLEAFRRTRLPLPYPGAPCLGAEVLRSLSLALPDADAWERELRRFLGEQVQDVTSEAAAQVLVAAALALSGSLERRGHRSQARDALADVVSRCRSATFHYTPWQALLRLVHLEIGLGHHDEAEALLRRLRQDGPEALRGRGLLYLGEIATTRQEPWAENIFGRAAALDLEDDERLRLGLLRVERAVRLQRLAEARRHLEGLAGLARRVGDMVLEAATCLATGDVARLARDTKAADSAYHTGLERAGDRSVEVRGRLLLRTADRALEDGDRGRAAELYREAAQGFAQAELPVREAWALLRLARVGAEVGAHRAGVFLQAARERFIDADLAAGIAAADSLSGDPGASLRWHLERATAQARARYDAQRSRPPWGRADADRPERRLGAHRLAIAACDGLVVDALAAQMDRSARAIVGRGRPTDPPVLQYVASVDLLAGHRSYEAATVLLEHLLQKRVDGVAYRALQGAVARSPNAALVDGLLRCVERPKEYPGRAVAAAAELLGLRRERSATPALARLSAPGAAPLRRKAAVTALGRIGDRRAVDCLVEALEEPALAEAGALSLLMLGDRRGVDFHGRALMQQRTDLSGHPGEIVGRYGGPDHLLLLIQAAKGEDERALGALQGLGLMGDVRAVPTLLAALHVRHSRVKEVASGALQILTGHVEDAEQPGVRTRWHTWWEENGGRFSEGIRYRDGQVFDAGLLLNKMSHQDSWVRRTSYDELVITSGKNLPFDADGPWRVQQAHLRAWREWWRGAKQVLRPGRWYLDGRLVH